jgi:hypothetical protein
MRWKEYQERKLWWMQANPGYTPQELEQACKRIAKELGL